MGHLEAELGKKCSGGSSINNRRVIRRTTRQRATTTAVIAARFTQRRQQRTLYRNGRGRRVEVCPQLQSSSLTIRIAKTRKQRDTVLPGWDFTPRAFKEDFDEGANDGIARSGTRRATRKRRCPTDYCYDPDHARLEIECAAPHVDLAPKRVPFRDTPRTG